MNITVIGGGPGGYEAAIYAAKAGAKVTLVEKSSVGGTCLNVGCIPTKALLAASDTLQTVRKSKDFGVTTEGEIGADYAVAVARKDKTVETLVSGVEYTLEQNSVELVRGTGHLKDKRTVLVDLNEGGTREVAADAIILATGSAPAVPGFLPVDGESIITSDHLLSLTKAPASIIIVGGGVIGCEIGQLLSRMGSKVTIVEMLPHLLPLEDEDTVKTLARQFRKDKIKAITGKGIQSVAKTGEGVHAVLADGTELDAELLLVSVGRRPYTEGLALENAGLETDKRGFIAVDGGMRTAADGIYAIGDIVATPQLAHLAAKEGFVAVDNILGGDKSVNYAAIPRCVYTEPEVASVGVTEQMMTDEGKPFHVGKFEFMGLGKAKAAGKTDGFAKVIVDEKDVIVGAAVVGAHATDMLQVLTLAIDLGLTAAQVGNAVFPHPTMCEGIMEALHDVHGKSVHKV